MKTIKINFWKDIPENFTGIIEYVDNNGRYWFLNGKFHREDGPAVELGNGTKKWFIHNKLHREDGPAVEWDNGDKDWYKEGALHREDGPAIEYSDGDKLWYKNGKGHRLDGPAIEYANGDKVWFLEDSHYDYKQINLNDFIVLDHFEGKFGIMWYKLLDEDEIFEYPDIPGLTTK